MTEQEIIAEYQALLDEQFETRRVWREHFVEIAFYKPLYPLLDRITELINRVTTIFKKRKAE